MATTFAFGKNWLDFAAGLQEEQIAEAQKSLKFLLGRADLSTLTFLDVGSGSGLFSLSARGLGARVHAFDADPDSVACTQALLAKYFPNDDNWFVERASILDTAYTSKLGTFDIVYAWGVLHHTGAMWSALERTASLVAPGGTLVASFYRKTPLCGAWRVEKRFYAAAPSPVRAILRGAYKAAVLVGIKASGRSPTEYLRSYRSNRGMNWHSDVHDWLGGYPYESARGGEVKARLERLALEIVCSVERPRGLGLFGSSNDEYVCQRRLDSTPRRPNVVDAMNVDST